MEPFFIQSESLPNKYKNFSLTSTVTATNLYHFLLLLLPKSFNQARGRKMFYCLQHKNKMQLYTIF